METTVTAVFADRPAALAVARQLESAGFGADAIELIDRETPDYHKLLGEETSDLARGAMLGAALGVVGFAIAGAAIAPLFESSLVKGATVAGLAGLGAGAAIGVLIGSATGHQVQEEYEHVIEGGAVLVAVNTDRGHGARALGILRAAGGTLPSTSVHRGHRAAHGRTA